MISSLCWKTVHYLSRSLLFDIQIFSYFTTLNQDVKEFAFLFLNFNLFTKFFFHQHINLSANQQDIHTKIKPQHNQHNCRQASIHISKSFEYIHVHGNQKRGRDPANCSKNGTWQLTLQFFLIIWQKTVYTDRKHHQHAQDSNCSDFDNKICNVTKYRYVLIHQ